MKKIIGVPRVSTQEEVFWTTVEQAAQELSKKVGESVTLQTIAGVMRLIPSETLDQLKTVCLYVNKMKEDSAPGSKKTKITDNFEDTNRFLQDLETSLNAREVRNSLEGNKRAEQGVFSYFAGISVLNAKEVVQNEETNLILRHMVELNLKTVGTAEEVGGLLRAAITRILNLKGKTGIQDLTATSMSPGYHNLSKGESIKDVLLQMPRTAEILTRFGEQSCVTIRGILAETGQQKEHFIRLYLVARVRQLQNEAKAPSSQSKAQLPPAPQSDRRSQEVVSPLASLSIQSSSSQTSVTDASEPSNLKSEVSPIPQVDIQALKERVLQHQESISEQTLREWAQQLKQSEPILFVGSKVEDIYARMNSLIGFLQESDTKQLITFNTPEKREEKLNNFIADCNRRGAVLPTGKLTRHIIKAMTDNLIKSRLDNATALEAIVREAVSALLVQNSMNITTSDAIRITKWLTPNVGSSDGFILYGIFKPKVPTSDIPTLPQTMGNSPKPLRYEPGKEDGNKVIVGYLLETLGLDKSQLNQDIVKRALESK